MLDLLTKSKIRKQIIFLFLYNPEDKYSLSEIARKIGTSAGTSQRELNRLMQNDLILFEKKSGLNIYSLNKKCVVLKEIEDIVKKTIGVEVELKNVLAKVKDISFAFLFGSYAKGGFKSDSDIDLFVIGRVDQDSVHKAVSSVENEIGRDINYHLCSEEEFVKKVKNEYFYKDILKKYIILIGDKNEFRRRIK